MGKRKEKAKTRREVWEREAREAKKAWTNEKAQEKKRKMINLMMYIFSTFGNMHCLKKQWAAYINN